MAPRPAWKGYLKLSLVTCAVELTNATTHAEKISFRMINRATGKIMWQLGGKHSIPLSEELSLVQTFLAIEVVRFGERLLTRFDVADDTLSLAVPPLVL